jgi:hypothetical protein
MWTGLLLVRLGLLITLAPTSDFKFSVGQVPSVEGYESVFPWNNSVGLVTAAFFVENSNSRGVQMDYSNGPLAGTVVFGDRYDTGVWNYIQFIGTDKIDTRYAVAFYGGLPLGVTGPNTFAYGEGGMSGGGANGNGGQANWPTSIHTCWAAGTSGLPTACLSRLSYSSNGRTTRANTPLSSRAASRTTSQNNQQCCRRAVWKLQIQRVTLADRRLVGVCNESRLGATGHVVCCTELVGFAFAPAYQYKQLFGRLNVGYVRLLNSGTPR